MGWKKKESARATPRSPRYYSTPESRNVIKSEPSGALHSPKKKNNNETFGSLSFESYLHVSGDTLRSEEIDQRRKK